MTSALTAVGTALTGSQPLLDEVGMSHRFVVSIDSGTYNLGSWSKVSGLSVSWSVCSYRPGDNNETWIAPGPTHYPTIKLSRAACADSQTVQHWLVQTTRRHVPLSGSIQMLDWTAVPIVEWKLKQFFPVGWAITDFDATGARPAMETLDIAHTGFLDDELAFGGGAV